MDKLDPFKRAASDLTPARVELGSTGVSLPTRALLDFQLDQAHARDAVQEDLAVVSLQQDLANLNISPTAGEALILHSAAPDRNAYLRRPDLGRRLAPIEIVSSPCDLVIVLADGLSALAVHRHAVPLLAALRGLLAADARPWTIGPVCIVHQGRVAIGDEIGERLGAEMVLMLLGERPGLSAPDSLGAYITWVPRIGKTDAERNCVSNIRPEGLKYPEAAAKIFACMAAARRLEMTGVALGRQLALSQSTTYL